MQREGLLGAACGYTRACNNSFTAPALGVLVDSGCGSAHMGRSVPDETVLNRGGICENLYYQDSGISVEIPCPHYKAVIRRDKGA